MHFRPALLAWFPALLLGCVTGCQKSESLALFAPPTVLAPDTAAQIHWLGKKRLGITAGAYYLSRVWAQPESVRLQAQTFDRLATNTWQLLLGGNAAAQVPPAVLRSFFDDLATEETYLEVRAASNTPSSAVFAIHVNAKRAGIWVTNLGIAAELLTGRPAVVHSDRHGWSLQTTNTFPFIQLSRVGDWTVVSAGPQQNPLADEIAARIRRDSVPFVSAGTNLWLEASLDLPRMVNVFPAFNSQLSTFNHLNFSVSGDGANVITRGKLTFSQPFAAPLEPWRLPVDLLHNPLTSFTAVRGLQSSLAAWPLWQNLEMGAAPDQLCFWSLVGSPYQVYLAAPLPDARQSVAALADQLLQKGNPWLAANGYISFDRAADGNGVTWGNLPDIKPFIKAAGTGADGWLFAGLLPETNTVVAPPPAGLINDVLRRTNLVYYDWEITGPRIQPVLALGQTVRLITRQPQLAMDSAAASWLGLLVPRLGTSATIATRTGPAELTFYRRATLGLTAAELQLLAGWLER